MTTIEKVINTIAENRNISAAEIKSETTFKGLQLDSLDIMDLIMEMEEKFAVTIELNEKIQTVGELAAYIDELLAVK